MNGLFAVILGSTWLDHLLTAGRGEMHLYHVVFFYTAAAILYPDKIVETISNKCGFHPGWRIVAIAELGSVALMIALTVHFQRIDPHFSSWEPFLTTGFWLLMRILHEACEGNSAVGQKPTVTSER